MTDAQLITHILSAYALTKDDISSLATSICQSRLNIAQASYRRAQKTTGLRSNYTPTIALQRRIERQSAKDAQSIAETYQSLLKSFLETFLEAKTLSKSWHDLFNDVRDAVVAIVAGIGVWMSDFLGWKSKQVANSTCGGGLDDGTKQFIGDLLEADSGDGTLEDDDGNTIIDTSQMNANISQYEITIEPDTASNDVCREVAGKTYSLLDYMEVYNLIGSFPVHPNCLHQAVIYQV